MPLAVIAELFVATAVAWQAWWLGWPAALIGVGAVVSYALWRTGPWTWTPSLRPAALLAIAAFVVHAIEELVAGLPLALPALFGRPGWSDGRFLVFIASWLVAFVVATFTARPGRRVPLLPLLFLGLIGGVVNGVAHLGLVLRQGAYFPGAWTAPVMLLAGLVLLGAMRPRSQIRAPDG